MFATAGVVVVVIVSVMVWPSRESVPSSEAPPPTPQVAGAIESITPPSSSLAPTPPRIRPTTTHVVAVAVSPDHAIDIDLPPVLIAENEATAYASLVARVRQSRFDVAVPVAPDPDIPLEIKELPPVEPLEIEPIVKLAALQAEGERP
jgi:hypothetical protein